MLNLMYEVRIEENSVHRKRTFDGDIVEDGFSVQRILDYRNGFCPMIAGRVVQDFKKTEIRIRMFPSFGAGLFMFLWFGFPAYEFMAAGGTSDFSGGYFMLFFGLLLMFGGFFYEVKQSENELMRIFSEKNKNYKILESSDSKTSADS